MRRLSLSSSIMKMVIPATKTEIKTSATANCANHAVSCSPRIYLSTRYMTGSMVKEKNIATPANIIRNAFCSSVMTASIDYDSLNIKEPVELPSIYIPELKNLVNGGGGESRTHDTLRYTGFRNRRTRPLCDASISTLSSYQRTTANPKMKG